MSLLHKLTVSLSGSNNGTSDETYEILDTAWRRREYIAGIPTRKIASVSGSRWVP